MCVYLRLHVLVNVNACGEQDAEVASGALSRAVTSGAMNRALALLVLDAMFSSQLLPQFYRRLDDYIALAHWQTANLNIKKY